MIDIKLPDLLLGFIILVLPIMVFFYYQVRLVKTLFISVIRMILQLGLVAVYLELIFEMNNAWINTLWVFIMVFVSAGTVVRRVGVNWRMFLGPFILAGIISIVIIDAFFLGLIIQLDYFFEARYFVPISGMILGNSLNHNIVGLTSYFGGLAERKELYYFLLTNGGSRRQALRPFVREALTKSLNPLLANISVIGLISLPGMMTGQILGGASPVTAIKYQVMIMVAIFTGCTLTLWLSILFSGKYVFDEMGNVREGGRSIGR